MEGRKFRTVWMVAGLLALSMISAIPTAAAEESDNLIWGVGYEWSNLNSDVDSLAGVSVAEMLGEFSEAADFAGFNLTILQISSGESAVFVEQWNNDTILDVQDGSGNSHYVTTRMTELTVRHGVLLDVGVLSDWADENASYDVSLYSDAEMVVTLDMLYTEYVTADLDLVAVDLTGSAYFEGSYMVGTDLYVEGGNETLDWQVELDVSMSWSLESLELEWVLDEPLDIYSQAQDEVKPGSVEYYCGEWNSTTGEYFSRCGEMTGEYTTQSDYSISLTGLPADEIGLEADEFDLIISDSFPDSGTFTEEVNEGFYFSFEDSGQDVTVYSDSPAITAYETEGAPLPPAMGIALGMGSEAAFVGSGSTESMAEAIEVAVENWGDNVEESVEGDDVFVCDDGEEIPASWVNDGEGDCADGSDEGVVEESGPADIFEEKLQEIAAAFIESNFLKTSEAFGEKLEDLLSGYEADYAYSDGELYSLWSDDEARYVGIQMLVETDSYDTYALFGPDLDTYADAPTGISLQYYIGDDAEIALAESEDEDTLEELAPVSEHDLAALEEMLGIEADDPEEPSDDSPVIEEGSSEGGLLGLPAPSLISVLFVVLGAAMVATITPRRQL